MLIYTIAELEKRIDGLRVLTEEIRINSYSLTAQGMNIDDAIISLEHSTESLAERIREIKESASYKKEYEKSYI